MPDLNRKFYAGKMNKDLDERLVPNGEYRDAMNVQVSTSDDSDVGSIQNLLGNIDVSSNFFIDQQGEVLDSATLETYGFYCVGSITDDKNDKLYWMVSGIGIDFIAEYDYKTKKVSPIVVDIFQGNLLPGDSGRVLHFDKSYLITGINIIEDTLFWTDNNTEPKRIKISEIRIGTTDFLTHTQFYIPNPNQGPSSTSTPFISVGDLKHEHITVIKKGPQKPPTLEMKNTRREDIAGSGPIRGEVTTTLEQANGLSAWFDVATGAFSTSNQTVTFKTAPDFKQGDRLVIESKNVTTASTVSKKTKLIVEIINTPTFSAPPDPELTCSVKILSYDKNIDLTDTEFYVYLLQDAPLFEFVFPRFGCRYKYKDGEYSAFSPFSEVAFLPGRYDYLPKEGYNLAMVNTIRALGVCNFVDARSIPKDVVSIDILYKESNSPNIYSIKTVDKVSVDTDTYDHWNAISPTELRDPTLVAQQQTYGYLDIEAEMIHSILPSNQLLRSWDNVPRKALAQEVIGNRLVYANYLQNYNVFSSTLQRPSALYNDINYQDTVLKPSKNIEVDIKLSHRSNDVGIVIPEQLDAGKAYAYKSAKTIKSLRTYQVGVVYIDEFGRETPVFSDQKSNKNTTYIPKTSANKQTKLQAQIFSPVPDFAKNFKFFIKETSSEYYNLAMDRWYFADDGNIWISFPSSDRNKVDIETFLILKKAHESAGNPNEAITDVARYKILDIDNEAPTFIKTKRTAVRTINSGFVDAASSIPIIMPNGTSDTNFPYIDGTFVQIHDDVFGPQAQIWNAETEPTEKQFRLVSSDGASDWYDVKSWENPNFQPGSTTAANATIGVGGYWKITSSRKFGVDMSITTPFSAPISTAEKAYGNVKIEFIKKEEKNLPEFEGRFFVKILKDAQLQQHIIGYAGAGTTYTSINQIECQYINPMDSEVQTGGSLANGDQFYGQTDIRKLSMDNVNEDTDMHPNVGSGNGQNFWKLAGNTEDVNSASSGWFIDRIEAFRPFAYNAYYFNRSNEGGTTGAIPSKIPANSARAPYQQGSLFDLSTMGCDWNNSWDDGYGVTWPSPQNVIVQPRDNGGGLVQAGTGNGEWNPGWMYGTNAGGPTQFQDYFYGNNFNTQQLADNSGTPYRQLQLIGDCTNYFNGQGSENSGYLGNYDIATPVREINGKWYSVLKRAKIPSSGSYHKNGRILPAVGIDQNYDVISLSYAGIGSTKGPSGGTFWDGFTNVAGEENLKSYFRHTAWATQYTTQQAFADAVTTPGTIWRWKQDPSQVVYQTQTLSNAGGHGDDTNISLTDWNYNEIDYAEWNTDGGQKGVELYNYAKIQDYVTWHYLELAYFGDYSFGWCYAPMANWATQAIGNYANIIANDECSSGSDYYQIEIDTFPRMNSTDDDLTARANRYPMHTADWNSATNRRRRYTIHAKPLSNQIMSNGYTVLGNEHIGDIGPHFYSPTNNSDLNPHFDHNGDLLTTIPSTKAPGIRPDGMYTGYEMGSGYNAALSTSTIPGLKVKNTSNNLISPPPGSVTWQILDNYVEDGASEGYFSQNPGVWETEPKEKLGLEIYHEVGQIYPTELNETNLEQFFGPVYQGDPTVNPSYLIKNSKVTCFQPPPVTLTPSGSTKVLTTNAGNGDQDSDIRVQRLTWNGDKAYVWLMDINGNPLINTGGGVVPAEGETLIFTRADGSTTQINVKSVVSTFTQIYEVHLDAHNYEVTLPWFNAYSFGNGVESDRIRDDFNQVTIDNGPKVSAVLEEPYLEETRSSGLIYSGIYNSMSGVNNLNQFIQAEKITKDLNPIYGSIQKLFARNTDLVTLCEDKVFKILANKDALFNSDGNANLTATENVLGQTVPFVGDYGISKNPESFAADAFRLYFTDRTRGNVLRLSQDGITSISDYGMTDWFNDNLTGASRVIGSFDDKKSEYNISLDYYNYESYEVGIIGNPNIGPALPGAPTTYQYVATNELAVSYKVANNMEVDDTIFGTGIPVGTTVVSKQNLGGGQWKIFMSAPGDNTVLGSYVSYGVQQVGVPGPVIWKTRVYSSKDDLPAYTLSYSDSVRGWPSFKSFHYENGLSLNNDYFTIKEGQLYQHHTNELRNTFYNEFAESSIEVLFNEQSGSVKSFQTLDYEGTQSKVTSDGGLNQTSNSAEYWDNYNKLGWYVDNMFTDLQEAEPAEFKNKEGKWFSAVKGVATEWLDDGNAGNIDTKEFSYQGIDENTGVSIVGGDYTSWDCLEVSVKEPPGLGVVDYNWMAASYSSANEQQIFSYFFIAENQSLIWENYKFESTNGSYFQITKFKTATPLDTPYFNSIEELINYYINNGYNNVYTGISYNNFINTVGITPLNNGGYFSSSISYSIPPDTFECTEVLGLKTGPYPNEAACLADPNSKCNPICQTDNDVTVHVTDAWTIGCSNGKVSVEVYLAGNATSWSVEYFYSANGAPVTYFVDPNNYTHNGYSQELTGAQNNYYAVVTDNLGCTVQKNFTIGCNPVSQPCSPTNPHSFATLQVQNPQTTVNGCWEWTGPNDPTLATYSGSVTFTNSSLASPATYWGYNLYIVINGTAVIIESNTNYLAQDVVTINGLEEGDYAYQITDSQGCTYQPEPFTLTCTASPCDPPVLGQSSTSTTMSTSNDFCETDNNNGTHELLNVLSAPAGAYYIAYYRYDNTQYSSWPGFANASMMGAVQGPFTSTTPVGGNTNIVSYSGLSASNISNNNYAIVVSNDIDFECVSVNEFTITCGQAVCDQSTFPNYNIQVQPATSNDCSAVVYSTAPTVGTNNDGQIAFSSIVCQPAATYFTIEILYGSAISGFTSVYNSGQISTTASQPILGPGNLFSTDSVNAVNTPPYNTSIYVAVITDNLGCERRRMFQVTCHQSTVNPPLSDPTYECVNLPNVGGGFTSSCQALYDGSGTYSSLAACQAACNDGTVGVLNWKCTSPGNICQPTADPVNYIDVFDDQFDCNISCGLTTGPGA